MQGEQLKKLPSLLQQLKPEPNPCFSDTSDVNDKLFLTDEQEKTSSFVESSQNPLWYTHNCFYKYWQHYKYTRLWYMNHLHYLRNVAWAANWPINCTATNPKDYFLQPLPQYSQWQPNQWQQWPFSSLQQKRHSRRRRHTSKKQCHRKYSTSSNVTMTMETKEEFQMTDCFMEFVIESRKFRQERDASKAKDEKSEIVEQRINIEDVCEGLLEPSSVAPAERPGSRRASEIKQLYGEKAPLIHGLETALQMIYDQMIDIKQPKMWPNMPLKLYFD